MTDHQTETPAAPAAPPETNIVVPRSQDPAPEPPTLDAKAAQEAKERMTKTGGFWNRLAPEKEPAKAPEASPAKPPKEKETPAATAPAKAPDEEPEPKSDKKTKGRKKDPEIDPMEIARATGQEIGREMAKATQAANVPRGTTPEPDADVELPEEFRPDVAVFEEMAKLEPKRYGNIKKDLARYAKAESDYIEKWEKDHPDETYDGDADEHNAFYAKIRPNYDQKDFKLAEKSLIKKEIQAELRKEMSEESRTREVESERRRERATQIQPEVDRDMFNTLGEMIREVDPENAEMAKDWASIQKLDEKNPLLADVMVGVHNETKPIVAATLRLFRSVESPDPNNPVHQRLFSVIAKAEQDVTRLPIKERYDEDGRLFATQDEYAKMSPIEKSRHWYVGEREALALIRGQAIARTKSIYEQEQQKLARYSKLSNATQTQNHTPERRSENPPQPKPDNGSPSVSGRGTLPGDGQSQANKPTNGRDLFFGRHLSA